MDIYFLAAQKFVVSNLDEEGFNVSGEKPVFELTALATFVLSLARCTFSVLWVYGGRKEIDPDTIEMTISWKFEHNPTRFKQIEMDINWPSLPDKKLKATEKMAGHCTIHNSIEKCVDIVTSVRNRSK